MARARGDKRRVISSEIEIDAPKDLVWAILRDFDSYPEWNPFTVEVSTTLELGSPVDMRVKLRPPNVMSQLEYVTAVVEGERVCWGGNVGPRWFINADRCQVVTDLGDGRTRYSTTDAFRGAGVGLMFLVVGRHVQRGFDDVARALKARAEASA
ncbi:MAG: hypothetical protein QOC92_753 [Acidimicrobiaceae bacterium]